jgi:hypothetical protein
LEDGGQTEGQIRQKSVGGGVCGEVLKMIISIQHAKEAITSSSIYDKLESNLWTFETSSVTKNTCSAMLFPLIEFCFPKELLKAWKGE